MNLQVPAITDRDIDLPKLERNLRAPRTLFITCQESKVRGNWSADR